MILSKKGNSHVEIVLAIILFVASVSFILFIFNVGSTVKNNDSSLEFVSSSITKYALSSVIKYSASIDNSNFNPQVQTQNDVAFVELPISISNEQGISVVDYNGTIFESFLDSDRKGLYIKKEPNKNYLFYIIISDDVTVSKSNPGFDKQTCVPYKISSSEKAKVTSWKKFQQLKDKYDRDYVGLKNELKISERIEFSFRIGKEQDFINAERQVPVRTEVFAMNKRKEVLKEDGRMEFVDYGVKVW